MMELLRAWLIGITCVAIIAAVVNALIPEGTVRSIARLVCGLLMLIAIIKPFASIDLGNLSSYIVEYKAKSNQYATDLTEENTRLLKAIIADNSAAYILDKANSLGVDCSATVTAKMGDNGYPYPYSVEIKGSATPDQKSALSEYIEAQLAIPKQRQQWS